MFQFLAWSHLWWVMTNVELLCSESECVWITVTVSGVTASSGLCTLLALYHGPLSRRPSRLMEPVPWLYDCLLCPACCCCQPRGEFNWRLLSQPTAANIILIRFYWRGNRYQIHPKPFRKKKIIFLRNCCLMWHHSDEYFRLTTMFIVHLGNKAMTTLLWHINHVPTYCGLRGYIRHGNDLTKSEPGPGMWFMFL